MADGAGGVNDAVWYQISLEKKLPPTLYLLVSVK